MSSLAHKKRRSTPLLRALAYNITKSPETLDLKKCADLFFAMAILNFPDAVLIDRICRLDIIIMLFYYSTNRNAESRPPTISGG